MSLGNSGTDASSQEARTQTELSSASVSKKLGMDLLVGVIKVQKRRIAAAWIQTTSAYSRHYFCFDFNS